MLNEIIITILQQQTRQIAFTNSIRDYLVSNDIPYDIIGNERGEIILVDNQEITNHIIKRITIDTYLPTHQ